MTALRKTSGIVLAAAAASLFIAPVVLGPTPAYADGGLQCSIETCDGEDVCTGTIITVETEEDCADSGGLLVEG